MIEVDDLYGNKYIIDYGNDDEGEDCSKYIICLRFEHGAFREGV